MGVDLRFDLRGPLFQLGHIDSLRLSLDEAAVLAERLGDARRLGQLYIFQSHYACLAGDYAAAVAAAEHARGVARQHDDPALELRAAFQRSLAQVGFGELDAAIEGMVQVAAQAEDPALGGRFGLDAELAIVALAYQARALADLGRFEAAERVVAACTARARQPFESIFAALAEGYVLLTRGRAVEAIVPLTEAVARCERAEADLMRPVALGFLGAAEAASGAVDAGLPRLEVAVAAATEMGFLFQQPLRLALLAEALLAAGRREDAVRRAEEAVTLARAQRDRVSLAVALRAATPAAITP
jgi:tetratricopeptide (TPR) repeat protein